MTAADVLGRSRFGWTLVPASHFYPLHHPLSSEAKSEHTMNTRTLHRPTALLIHEDEGCWDLVCHEAGDDE